jgi:methionyl-tRNA formyltransferase
LEGHRIFAENLPLLRQGKAPRIPQSQIPGVHKLYYRWEPHFARVPWNESAVKVALHVRALNHPKEIRTYSGEAYTYLGGQRVSIWAAQVAPSEWRRNPEAIPGEILALFGEGVMVQTGDGCVVLTDVDVQGASLEGLRGLRELLKPNLPAVFS